MHVATYIVQQVATEQQVMYTYLQIVAYCYHGSFMILKYVKCVTVIIKYLLLHSIVVIWYAMLLL